MSQQPIHWLLNTPAGSVIFLSIVLIFLALVYVVPSILAFSLRSSKPVLLLSINLLLGWTVIGWIVCLIWALVTGKFSDSFDGE